MTESVQTARLAVSLMLSCALVAGCVSSGTVVLLPEKDGHATAVVVKEGDKELVLDQPYAAAKVMPLRPRAYHSSSQEVEAQFGAALAAQPIRASAFTLYFVLGSDELTAYRRDTTVRRRCGRSHRPSGTVHQRISIPS